MTMLRPLAIRHYLRIMATKGIAAEEVFDGTRIDVTQMENPRFLIDYDQFRRIVENIVALDENRGLGLDMGLQIENSEFGVVGHAAAFCANLRECIEQLRAPPFGHVVGLMSHFKIENGKADTLTLNVLTPSSAEPVHRFYVEEAVATLFSLGARMTGVKPTFKQMRLGYPKPPYHHRYKELFDCPVVFDAPETQVALERDWVDLPLPQHDEEMNQFYRRNLVQILREVESSSPLINRVRDFLLQHCQEIPTVDRVAHEFGMTRRTFSRQLQRQGVCYRELVEEVRIGLAKEYIRTSRFPPKKIGETLGFKDVNAFRRAFKAWTGQTIRQYGTGR